MTAGTKGGAWWVRTPTASQPRMRLFCFPFAGGSASVFHGWNKLLPQDVEVVALQLPGRENRHREAAFRRIADCVPAVVEALSDWSNLPFCFFGYSLGGHLAFETARRLRREGRPLPRRLMVAASSAPQREHARNPPIHRRSDAEFLAELRRFKGTPEAVLKNPELLAFLLPTLRADFEMLETYVCAPEPPLPVPIVAFGGLGDQEVAPDALADWSTQTSAGFSLQFFPGDHFFFKTSLNELLAHVGRETGSSAGIS